MTKKTHEETEGDEFATNHTNIHPDLEDKINRLEKKNKELEQELREATNSFREEALNEK